jgi:hypothetical protein
MLRKLHIAIHPKENANCLKMTYVQLERERNNESRSISVRNENDLLSKLADLVAEEIIGDDVEIEVIICDGGDKKGLLRCQLTYEQTRQIVKERLEDEGCARRIRCVPCRCLGHLCT